MTQKLDGRTKRRKGMFLRARTLEFEDPDPETLDQYSSTSQTVFVSLESYFLFLSLSLYIYIIFIFIYSILYINIYYIVYNI